MNELTKTLIFTGVAALVAVVAFVFRPAPFEPVRQQAGDKLFADLTDASSADALQIVRYDADVSKPIELMVKRDGGDWVIASHNDYPADASDAKDRIQNVALKLIDLEIIEVASELTGEHALYGVISPETDAVKEADEEDIGLLVGLQDADGNILAQLIVGKQAQSEQDTGSADAPKRFVRKAGESTVYTAAIDTDGLKSNFADWIEPDLLDITGGDVRRVTIKDYNVHVAEARGPDGRPRDVALYEPRFEMSVDWDDKDSQWQFASMVERRGNRLAPSELTKDEELNGEKLDGLKSAVDSLKIVDVAAKPKELIEGVKSDEDLINDADIGPLLQEKGFYPMRGELLSSDGEVRVQTEEGIEYILRFGKEAGVEQDEDNQSKLTRYMLVSAKVAEEQFLPEEEPEMTSPTGDEPAGPALGAGGQAGEDGEAGTGDETNDETGEAASGDEATADDEGDSEDPEPSDGNPTAPPDTIPPMGDGGTDSAEDDELAQKRKAAEDKVAELNKRFANWYYVISEDEYKRIRLGRFDLIQEKDESSFGLDELKDLDELPREPGGELPDIDSP